MSYLEGILLFFVYMYTVYSEVMIIVVFGYNLEAKEKPAKDLVEEDEIEITVHEVCHVINLSLIERTLEFYIISSSLFDWFRTSSRER